MPFRVVVGYSKVLHAETAAVHTFCMQKAKGPVLGTKRPLLEVQLETDQSSCAAAAAVFACAVTAPTGRTVISSESDSKTVKTLKTV